MLLTLTKWWLVPWSKNSHKITSESAVERQYQRHRQSIVWRENWMWTRTKLGYHCSCCHLDSMRTAYCIMMNSCCRPRILFSHGRPPSLRVALKLRPTWYWFSSTCVARLVILFTDCRILPFTFFPHPHVARFVVRFNVKHMTIHRTAAPPHTSAAPIRALSGAEGNF